jgi:putative ABC transport system permease protein
MKVIELVAKQGLLPVALGIAAGLGAATTAARLLRSVLYEMSPNDPLVYALVTGLLIITAIAAISVPARRAATADPVIALREE